MPILMGTKFVQAELTNIISVKTDLWKVSFTVPHMRLVFKLIDLSQYTIRKTLEYFGV